MSQITKELFISSIEAIRIQMYKDVVNADCIAKMFNTENVVGYDTSLVTTKLIELLQVHFPKDTNGFCDIEHYCFDTNFGKAGSEELVITVEDLWVQLNKQKLISVKEYQSKYEPIFSTHPLIDDNPNPDGK